MNGAARTLIRDLEKRGVRLWSQDGQLRYKAPCGTLSSREVKSLGASRVQLLSVLAGRGTPGRARAHSRAQASPIRAPLSYTQLAHWRQNKLNERPSLREVAAATLLRGPLDIDRFRSSVQIMVARHEALRTQIVNEDGAEPTQVILSSPRVDFRVHDLSELPSGERDAEVQRHIDSLILQPIRVATDPLFGARLLRLSDQEHVFVVAMEHMISDGASLLLFQAQLRATYEHSLPGLPGNVPDAPLQFADYAVLKRRELASWIERHGAWADRSVTQWKRLRFPPDPSVATTNRSGWGAAPVLIDSALRAELVEWCRVRRTTLVMAVLSAYVGLVLRWCTASAGVIQYQVDNRSDRALQNTIGYFASVLYLNIELPDDANFVDLVGVVTREWCEAYDRVDHSYIASLEPTPEFAKNTCFNWISQDSSAAPAELGTSTDTLTWSRSPFEHPAVALIDRDNEPEVLLFDLQDHVEGAVFFPRSRFSDATAERFGRNFLRFLVAMVRQPDQRLRDLVIL
jgi:hypothetical protein